MFKHSIWLPSLVILMVAGLSYGGDVTDVKLGFLNSISQPTGSHIGAWPNGTAGITMATTSCNVGSVDVPWWSIYNDASRSWEKECPDDPPSGMSGCHPSIGMEMYRMRSGRLDQIGLSWLKHGWFALSSSQCTQCTNGDPSGNHLGVACSDTYSGGNNADRDDLGPRSEWNPYTNDWDPCGTHFDGANNDCTRTSHSHGLIDHRVRVADADIVDNDANYFYQAVYYVKYESALGDNIGWQPIDSTNWNGSRWFFATSHSSTPTYGPIIRLWDPSAVELDTGEGLAYAGARITQVGDLWHYEYAVYNYTSNIPFTSFSVPMPNGASVSNTGFHDYDDTEEGWNTADWELTREGGMLTWAGHTYDEDVDANALRFGRQYNFWFDADVAPVSGEATLGLFLPGQPESIFAAIDVPDSAGPIAIVHGNPGWDRDNSNTWVPFSEWAFGGYIDPGVESTDGINVDLGLSSFDVRFNREPFGDAFGGAISTANVSMEQTGGAAPGVVSAVKNGNVISVQLDRNITLQEWTTLVFAVWDGDGVAIVDNGNEGEEVDEVARLDVGYQPSDVSNDGSTEPLDVQRFISAWINANPMPQDATNGHPNDYVDTDRNGAIQPRDLNFLIRSMKDIGRFPYTRNWRGVGMNNTRP